MNNKLIPAVYIYTYIPSIVPRVYCPELLTRGTDLSVFLTLFYKEIRCHDNDIIITYCCL